LVDGMVDVLFEVVVLGSEVPLVAREDCERNAVGQSKVVLAVPLVAIVKERAEKVDRRCSRRASR
jgi:hypothetical protein